MRNPTNRQMTPKSTITLLCPHCGQLFQGQVTHRIDFGHPVFQDLATLKMIRQIDPEELHQLTQQFSVFTVARLYGIPEKTIRKICREYGFPYHTEDPT